MHSNDVSLFMLEQVPLFKHGPDEHGLVSLWQDTPVLYWLHWQTYCCSELIVHTPWLEQLAKHDDKSPVYVCNTLFNWLPELFWLNIEDELIETERVDFDITIDNSVVVVVMSTIVDVERDKESENEVLVDVIMGVGANVVVVETVICDVVVDVEVDVKVVVNVDVVVLVVVVVVVVVVVALKNKIEDKRKKQKIIKIIIFYFFLKKFYTVPELEKVIR